MVRKGKAKLTSEILNEPWNFVAVSVFNGHFAGNVLSAGSRWCKSEELIQTALAESPVYHGSGRAGDSSGG